jgi:hypothetical protein
MLTEAIDTVKSNTARRNLYYHDFRENAKKERIVDLRKDTYLDLRDYSNEQKDSAVHCNIDYIQILDSNNKIIFSWNPVNRINPELFNFKETLKQRGFGASNSDLIEWTRLTSALWDYDGDILYSMKNIGIGKISRKTGEVIWQINNIDLPLIDGKDTIQWYNPHDFNFLYANDSTATYSIYSNGDMDLEPAKGIVFEMNKKTQKFKLIKNIYPSWTYFAQGQGNIDYKQNGDYVIGYGNFDESDTATNKQSICFEFGNIKKGVQGVYTVPVYNRTYKAHKLEGFPKPERPLIVKKSDLLEAQGNFKDFVWYKMTGKDNTTLLKVGEEKTIKAEKGVTYCVESKLGIGYSVSQMFKND